MNIKTFTLTFPNLICFALYDQYIFNSNYLTTNKMKIGINNSKIIAFKIDKITCKYL